MAKATEVSDGAACVGAFVLAVLLINLQTWAVMLVAGALHAHAEQFPALSYTASFWLLFLVHLIVSPAMVRAKN